MRKLLILLAFTASQLFATQYYVTQSGGATPLSTNSGSPSSVATYNASALPTGGDTVTFTGTITTAITPNKGGTGTGGSRLILDFTAATLNVAGTAIHGNGKSHIVFNGGGTWANGVWTPGASIGGLSSGTVVYFDNQVSDDITITGFSYDGGTNSTSLFLDPHSCTNLLVAHLNLDNCGLCWVDKNTSHDITFFAVYCRTSTNTVSQTDVFSWGDAYNITIDGCKLIQRAPGDSTLPIGNARHNDVIQCYQGGGSNSGAPYGFILRNSWIELDVSGGSGDNSQLILEGMADNGGTPAAKVYGNVFNGKSGTAGNNGITPNGNSTSSTLYFYNNTMGASAGHPGNVCRFQTPAGTLYARNNAGEDPVGGGGTYLLWQWNAGATWDYNFFHGWGSPSSTYTGPHGLSNTSLGFTNPAAYDFSTQIGSPLRGAGDSTIGAEYNQGPASNAGWPNPTLVSRVGSWDAGALQSGGGDTTAPTPNPSTIASTSHTSSSVSVTATTATDASSPPVQYRFSKDSGSTWTSYQSSSSYTFTSLTASTAYQVKVQAEDSATTPNVTGASSATTVTTDASGSDTTPPTPSPSTIASTSHTPTTITVTATTATDATSPPTQYAFSSNNGSSYTSFQSSATYTFSSLSSSTTYQVKVKARDSATIPNETTPSSATGVTTDSPATITITNLSVGTLALP
jgi:hypothetical protein